MVPALWVRPGQGYLDTVVGTSYCTVEAVLIEHWPLCRVNGRILLANSNRLYFNNLVKIPCHKTPYRCPHRLSLSSQSSCSCAGLKIKVLKDKGLEFANSIRAITVHLERSMARAIRGRSGADAGSRCLHAVVRLGCPHTSSLTTAGVLPDVRSRTPRSSPAPAYWITSSARKRSVGGIVRPRVLAVLRLRISSNVVGRSMGRSPGLAPFRILST
jgi:hypothetical protein